MVTNSISESSQNLQARGSALPAFAHPVLTAAPRPALVDGRDPRFTGERVDEGQGSGSSSSQASLLEAAALGLETQQPAPSVPPASAPSSADGVPGPSRPTEHRHLGRVLGAPKQRRSLVAPRGEVQPRACYPADRSWRHGVLRAGRGTGRVGVRRPRSQRPCCDAAFCLQDPYPAFFKTDTDRDGLVSTRDLHGLLERLQLRLRDEEFERLLGLLGLRFNATLNFREFENLLEKRPSRPDEAPQRLIR